MKNAILMSLLLSFYDVNAQIKNHKKYKCKYSWQTALDKKINKNFNFENSTTIKMNDTFEANLIDTGISRKIIITEFYKNLNTDNFLQYNFQCSPSLSCTGSRVSNYQGKTNETKLVIKSESSLGMGLIENRPVFIYRPRLNNNFEFQYILFDDQYGISNGMIVTCDE